MQVQNKVPGLVVEEMKEMQAMDAMKEVVISAKEETEVVEVVAEELRGKEEKAVVVIGVAIQEVEEEDVQVEEVEIDQEVVVVIAQEAAQEAEDEENLSKYKGRKEAGKAYLCRTFFKKS